MPTKERLPRLKKKKMMMKERKEKKKTKEMRESGVNFLHCLLKAVL